MISPDQALDLVLVNSVRRPSSRVDLLRAAGLSLAQNIRADRDFPPFDRASTDGYGVSCSDAGRVVEVAGEVAAGAAPTGAVGPGTCYSVMTGAACPPGTEAVVKVEETRPEGRRVRLPREILPGQHISPRGCECRAGTVVLEVGHTLTPLSVATLASVGREHVQATDLPALAVITIGHERSEAGGQPGAAQARNSMGPMLAAQARRMGLGHHTSLLSAPDTPESLAGALQQAADADLVVLCGGTSAGLDDRLAEALARQGATLVFHRVAQSPGMPMLLARRQEQLLFGLPGTPLDSHLCFQRYVAAAARKMAGQPQPDPAFQPAVLTRPLRAASEHARFVLGSARRRPDGALAVQPHPGKGTADIFSGQLSGQLANGYLRLEPGQHDLAAGDLVPFQFLE